MGQLVGQRGQLTDAIDRRAEAQEGLTISNRLIRQMHRRAAWMRVSLCLIILMLAGALVTFICLKFLPSNPHPHPQPVPPSPSPSPSLSPAVRHALGENPSSLGSTAVAADALATEAVRRVLQTASPPPPSTATATATASTSTYVRQIAGVGPGIITIGVVGGLSLLACIVALPKSIVVRFIAFSAAIFLFAATCLVLLLMPRDGPPTATTTDAVKLTDVSTTLRIFLIVIASVLALVALALVGLIEGFFQPRAPSITETDIHETYRLAAAVSKA